ncbi:MAG: protein jag [Lachnospiraceae bacterium]|nr:protein jag [Lachnospiraceae bacterium]
MYEWKEYSAKTVEEAITNACVDLVVSRENIDYEVVEKGSTGFFGIHSKQAVIKARIRKEGENTVKAEKSEEVGNVSTEEKDVVETTVENVASQASEDNSNKVVISEDEAKAKVDTFLKDVFGAMGINVVIEITSEFGEEEKVLNVNLTGDEMGILIGKRGGTLDSLQYLVGLVVNKNSVDYIKVKLDTENYRERRKATLENLAKNLAQKVKRTHRPVFLEPMNPYERRIIHYTLQSDEYVETHSEGEEPYRKVVITMKPGVRYNNYRKNNYNRGKYGNNRGGYKKGGYNKGGYRKNYNNNYKKYDNKQNEEKTENNSEN